MGDYRQRGCKPLELAALRVPGAEALQTTTKQKTAKCLRNRNRVLRLLYSALAGKMDHRKRRSTTVQTQLEDKPQEPLSTLAERPAEDAGPGRALAGVLTLVCAAAITVASFYPFQPIHNPTWRAERLHRFLHSLSADPANLERLKPEHLCLNFFFYLPLGVLVSLALTRPGKRRGSWIIRTGALGWGFILSLAIEYLQIGYENRDPDLSDTLMNTLGYLAGLFLIRRLIRSGRLSPAMLLGSHRLRDRQGVARLACIAYVLLLLAAGLLRPALLAEGFFGFAGRFHVSWTPWPQAWRGPLDPWTARRALLVAALGFAFIPLGFLFRSGHYFWNGRRLLRCLLLGAALAAALEAAHATLPGKSCDLSRILGAMLGAMAGSSLAGWRRRP